MIVLDASAVLAVIFGERGADRVSAVAAGSMVLTVNMAEVLGRLQKRGANPADAQRRFDLLALSVIPFDRDLAVHTGALLLRTEALGLSLGDRACLALGIRTKALVLTSDARLARATVGARIEMIR